jgi:hypothetical protein
MQERLYRHEDLEPTWPVHSPVTNLYVIGDGADIADAQGDDEELEAKDVVGELEVVGGEMGEHHAKHAVAEALDDDENRIDPVA